MQLIGKQVGNYLLKRRLGQGGMGEVYAAEDQVLKRQVAVKIMLQVIPHRSLKFRANIKNHRPIGDRQQERSLKGSRSAAEEEKEA